ncbi:MAG: hypothetical protein DYG94_02880 [Leptolyngbya sp. PLA3]|nr:MAG: hypothetical protein EDM82_11420 [Cyanobacteria bacterium CYA]MCE7967673.1 hypothetical protein [Leptolyngbya sp. PL-A3]
MTRTVRVLAATLSCIVFTSLAQADAADPAQRCIQATNDTAWTMRQRVREAAQAGHQAIAAADRARHAVFVTLEAALTD